jgi:excisionase family DNA binding protein
VNTEPLGRADVLSATEASLLLGIPRSTLYDLARRGELPARRIGRRWIFRRSLLNRATLPQAEPESWLTTRNGRSNEGLKLAKPLPATVARSARIKQH